MTSLGAGSVYKCLYIKVKLAEVHGNRTQPDTPNQLILHQLITEIFEPDQFRTSSLSFQQLPLPVYLDSAVPFYGLHIGMISQDLKF
jgi:hypothetical protein